MPCRWGSASSVVDAMVGLEQKQRDWGGRGEVAKGVEQSDARE